MTCFLLGKPRGKFPFAPWNCSLQLTEIGKVGEWQRLFLVLSTLVLPVLQTGKNSIKSITALHVIFSSYSVFSGPQVGQVVLYLWPPGARGTALSFTGVMETRCSFLNCPQQSWNQAVPLSMALLRIWGKWKGDATPRITYIADQPWACYRSSWLSPSLLMRWKLLCLSHSPPLTPLPASEMLEESPCLRPMAPMGRNIFSFPTCLQNPYFLSQAWSFWEYLLLSRKLNPHHSVPWSDPMAPIRQNTVVLQRIKQALLWQQTPQDLRKWLIVQKGLSGGLCTGIWEIFWSCFCSV